MSQSSQSARGRPDGVGAGRPGGFGVDLGQIFLLSLSMSGRQRSTG